jgi:hypothetical protein
MLTLKVWISFGNLRVVWRSKCEENTWMKLCDLGAPKERESVCVWENHKQVRSGKQTLFHMNQENTLGGQNPNPRKNHHLSG